MIKPDYKAIFAEVQENSRRLAACTQHRFNKEVSFGKPWLCQSCGGRMDAGQVLAYCEGFKAAGGDPTAVWPPYEARR